MPIITASYIALALFLGYVVAVGLSMAATFGMAAASRQLCFEEQSDPTTLQVRAGCGMAGLRDGGRLCCGRW